MNSILLDIYRRLYDHFGHRNWWPGETPFEVCVGAVLTQNTSWRNVAGAIVNLKEKRVLEASAIYNLTRDELAELIRPAGYYNVKEKRLRNFVNFVVEEYSGNLEALFAHDIPSIRKALLGINGIGKETADIMILYAAKKPIFVVDAYTARVVERHGLLLGKLDYDSIQKLFNDNLEQDTELYNDFHAQIVAVGHNYCKKKPKCGECPLNDLHVQV